MIEHWRTILKKYSHSLNMEKCDWVGDPLRDDVTFGYYIVRRQRELVSIILIHTAARK